MRWFDAVLMWFLVFVVLVGVLFVVSRVFNGYSELKKMELKE